ncbi:hypothetical protein HSB1_40850 [Halogranum salarium B-1]|uniref:Uncharacterized protein n=1 Tax=Halogranum salarium B-1 TaxID=1210908 RepID=J3JDR7_9EURY|nr:hypothetical protein HSB1_40850 [Halogranum salarium B-1]
MWTVRRRQAVDSVHAPTVNGVKNRIEELHRQHTTSMTDDDSASSPTAADDISDGEYRSVSAPDY